jgi:hypothetical protein
MGQPSRDSAASTGDGRAHDAAGEPAIGRQAEVARERAEDLAMGLLQRLLDRCGRERGPPGGDLTLVDLRRVPEPDSDVALTLRGRPSTPTQPSPSGRPAVPTCRRADPPDEPPPEDPADRVIRVPSSPERFGPGPARGQPILHPAALLDDGGPDDGETFGDIGDLGRMGRGEARRRPVLLRAIGAAPGLPHGRVGNHRDHRGRAIDRQLEATISPEVERG